MKSFALPLAAAIAFLVAAGPAFAGGSPDQGRRIFSQCRACHSLEAGKNLIGPSLHGLFGRKAGTVTNYNYTKAMKDSGIVWNAKTLNRYLTDPRKMVPGNKMAFFGLKTEQQRADLIAYLEQATK